MSQIEPIAQGLYDKLKNRFGDIAISDQSAKPTSEVEQGRFFNFDYKIGSTNYGNVTISINDGESLKIFFNRRISKKMAEEDRPTWYKFLKALRSFSRRNMLRFDTRDITRKALTKKEIKDMATNVDVYNKAELDQIQTNESKLYGSSKSSYQKLDAKEGQNPVKIIVRHAKKVDEEKHGARARNISAIFVETKAGERFKLPFTKLVGARAMARHLMNGGGVSDDLGIHIVDLVEEMADLGQFVRLMKNKPWEKGETKEMVEAAVDRYQGVRATLNSLTGPKGYAKFAEAFEPEVKQLDDFNADTIKEKFVQKSFPEKLESALPHVYSAHKAWSKNMSEQLQQVHEFVRTDESINLGKTHGNKSYFESLSFVDTKALLKTVLEQVSEQADGAIKEFATKWASRVDTLEEHVDESLKEEYGMAVQLAKQYIKGVKSIKESQPVQEDAEKYQDVADELLDYADEAGIDKGDFLTLADLVRSGDPMEWEDFLRGMDTSPREKAHEIMDKYGASPFTVDESDEYADWADSMVEDNEVDEDAIRELVLYIENDGQLYQQQGEPIMRNLTKKWDKGVYDHDKAKTLWKYYADTGAKKYGKEHGANDGFNMFTPAVRRAVASELADGWHEELKAGNKMEGQSNALDDYDADYDPHKDPVLTQTPAYKMSMGIQKGLRKGKKLFNKFRQGLADKIAPAKQEEDVTEAGDTAPHEKLQKLVGQHFPVGQDGSNAITALQGIIDDEGLNADIQKMADEDGPDTCGRPAVHKYLSDANPELLKLLNFGDMTMETLGGDASEDFVDSVIDKKKKKHGETTAEDIKRLSGIK